MASGSSTINPQFVRKAIDNVLKNEKCIEIHEGTCNEKAFNQFFRSNKSLYKIYLIAHLIPFFLFKRKKLKQKPTEQLFQFIKGFIKSLLFAGGYTTVYCRIVCLLNQYYKFDGINYSIGAFLGGITLMFQPIGRQTQIALFTLTKSMEVSYNMAIRRKIPVKLPYGQCLLMGIAACIVCYNYKNHRQLIKSNYLSILDLVLKQH